MNENEKWTGIKFLCERTRKKHKSNNIKYATVCGRGFWFVVIAFVCKKYSMTSQFAILNDFNGFMITIAGPLDVIVSVSSMFNIFVSFIVQFFPSNHIKYAFVSCNFL